MHIPDGFLSTNTWVATWGISAGGLWVCIRKVSGLLKDKMVPLMGVLSAFIFAAQMVNFPVAGGTSGHFLGGALAVILLGPYAGAIVLSIVLIAQCLIFQDGGLTALGANIFNMSFIGAIGGYLVYRLIKLVFGRGRSIILAGAVSAWFSVVLASAACAIELGISGTSPFNVVIPAMIGIHAIIGIGEAAITSIILGFILKVRPDLIYNEGGRA